MSAPRPLDDGARAGYGLLLFILATGAILLGALIDAAALIWTKWRRL